MDEKMFYGKDYKYIPTTSITSGLGIELVPDLFCYNIQIANICFIGEKDSDRFVLVDAGMPKSAERIISAAEERFGQNSRPEAIILTHGHFDHVGAVIELVNHWQVPVYAHELEMPYLIGEKSYPDPDSTVEGGLVAKLSTYFPNDPINLSTHVQMLPKDRTIPFSDEFQWFHTPGHSPGHISLFREKDRSLIVGDAFITVRQDSLYKVLTQEQEINGPPRYLTTDWKAAKRSVKMLEQLKPELAITGHGLPMTGEELSKGLTKLVNNFEELAIPDYGRFIH